MSTDAPTPLRKLNKVESARLKKKTHIRESCEAGIKAVLSDELVNAALELLDDVSASLFRSEYGDPTNPIRTQVLRSSGSVAANLAEGIGKAYEDDKRKFFLQARGSAYETVIWLRALSKHDLLDKCIGLCEQIDASILKLLDSDEDTASE